MGGGASVFVVSTIRHKLVSAAQANAALNHAYKTIKPHLLAGEGFDLSIKPAKRSLSQNDKFHALCEDYAKSGVKWQGKERTKDQWKVLLISGHAIATKEGAEMIPGLEGEFVNVRESSASMTKARGSSLIEYSTAMAAHLGVRLRAPEYMETAC